VSLQAAAKLSAETEFVLNFRLQGVEPAIETMAYVAWLDPSRKEAGISFRELSSNAEQQIAKWIASQEQPTGNTQTETEPHPVPAARGESLRLPIQASIPVIFPSERPESGQQGFVPRILGESLSQSREQNDFESALEAMPPPAPVSATLPFRTRPEEKFEPLADAPFELPAKHYELRIEPQSLPAVAHEILPRDCLLPNSISPRRAVVAADRLASAVPDSTATDLRRRRKFAIALAVSMMAVVALMVMATGISRPPVLNSSNGPTIQPISPSAAALPAGTPQTRPQVQPGGRVRTAPSSTAPTDVDPVAPVPVVRVAVAPVQQESGFMGSLRTLLGLDVANTIDPAEAALPVWTVQHSGFYYCARSPDFRTLEPGAIMTQGQALQSGYQPKLGSYCE
jgi:hypothetical protein